MAILIGLVKIAPIIGNSITISSGTTEISTMDRRLAILDTTGMTTDVGAGCLLKRQFGPAKTPSARKLSSASAMST